MTQNEYTFSGMHCKRWLADNEKAKLQIIHGLGEMSEYYEQAGEYFTKRGISVYLCEYRCHGRTKLAVEIDDILQISADECYYFSENTASASDTPLFLLGHSLGAQMVQYILGKHGGNLYNGVIMTGCPYIENTDELLLDIDKEAEIRGNDAPSMDVFMKVFGRVAEPFEEKCTVSWVTSDIERALYYEKLPYTNVMYSCRFYKSFLRLSAQVQQKNYLSEVAKKPPLLIMSGTMDTVGQFGQYARKKADELEKCGYEVEFHLFDGMRHSILQERNRTDVMRIITEFAQKQFS